jgi:hypothetical protein
MYAESAVQVHCPESLRLGHAAGSPHLGDTVADGSPATMDRICSLLERMAVKAPVADVPFLEDRCYNGWAQHDWANRKP